MIPLNIGGDFLFIDIDNFYRQSHRQIAYYLKRLGIYRKNET
jgi:hypothetical protein